MQPPKPSAPPDDSAGSADTLLSRLISEASEQGVKLVRFLICDTSSAVRGKCVSIGSAPDRFASGVGLVKGTMAQNMLDQLQTESGFGATGEVRLVPDYRTFKILPYTQASAAVLCDLVELDGKAWSVCPRSFLKRQIAQAEELGIFIRAAFEPEFIVGSDVLDGYGIDGGDFVPIDRGQCFSAASMNEADRLITKIVESLEMQGLEVEQYYPELGHGEHEISIKHAPALNAADNYILMRETIRGVACQMDYTVTFTPKLSADDPGSGCHLHLSAWDKGYSTNLFAPAKPKDKSERRKKRDRKYRAEQKELIDQKDLGAEGERRDNLSDLARQFIAGIVEHLPALVALTCASVNSYRRLQPKSWASAYTCWGLDNREAAVRVPSTFWGMEEATTNIEIKCVDNTANPYLALGAVIACGLDGVRRKLTPPPPVQGDPSELSHSEMQDLQVSRLPQSLGSALTELAADEYLMKELGPELANTFIVVKASEVQVFLNDSDFEFSMHKLRY
jgi:glutamine synthetase